MSLLFYLEPKCNLWDEAKVIIIVYESIQGLLRAGAGGIMIAIVACDLILVSRSGGILGIIGCHMVARARQLISTLWGLIVWLWLPFIFQT